jgi:hypothetical protein
LAEVGWNCRFSIADLRNSKLENRNSQKAPLQPDGAEFPFSNFDFLLPQSARRGGSMKTQSLVVAVPRC